MHDNPNQMRLKNGFGLNSKAYHMQNYYWKRLVLSCQGQKKSELSVLANMVGSGKKSSMNSF